MRGGAIKTRKVIHRFDAEPPKQQIYETPGGYDADDMPYNEDMSMHTRSVGRRFNIETSAINVK